VGKKIKAIAVRMEMVTGRASFSSNSQMKIVKVFFKAMDQRGDKMSEEKRHE